MKLKGIDGDPHKRWSMWFNSKPVSYTHLDVYKRQALAHAHVNVKMIDQGSSELNIIIGVRNHDFELAIKAIYDIFVSAQL